MSSHLGHMVLSTSLIHQALHLQTREDRVLRWPQKGPKGDYEDHVVTTLPSPIWHTDTEERRPLKGCSSTGKGLAWHVWSPVLSPQHDRNLVWWHTLISPALGRWEGQREARGAEVLLGYTVSPGASRAT